MKIEPLAELCSYFREQYPHLLAGWDLQLSTAVPEDDPCIIDVFNLALDDELALMQKCIHRIRETEEQIGRSIVVIFNDLADSEKRYAAILRKLKAQRYEFVGTHKPAVNGYAPAA